MSSAVKKVQQEKAKAPEKKIIVLSPKQRDSVVKSSQEVALLTQELEKAKARNSEISSLILDAHGIDENKVVDAQMNDDSTSITLTLKG